MKIERQNGYKKISQVKRGEPFFDQRSGEHFLMTDSGDGATHAVNLRSGMMAVFDKEYEVEISNAKVVIE